MQENLPTLRPPFHSDWNRKVDMLGYEFYNQLAAYFYSVLHGHLKHEHVHIMPGTEWSLIKDELLTDKFIKASKEATQMIQLAIASGWIKPLKDLIEINPEAKNQFDIDRLKFAKQIKANKELIKETATQHKRIPFIPDLDRACNMGIRFEDNLAGFLFLKTHPFLIHDCLHVRSEINIIDEWSKIDNMDLVAKLKLIPTMVIPETQRAIALGYLEPYTPPDQKFSYLKRSQKSEHFLNLVKDETNPKKIRGLIELMEI